MQALYRSELPLQILKHFHQNNQQQPQQQQQQQQQQYDRGVFGPNPIDKLKVFGSSLPTLTPLTVLQEQAQQQLRDRARTQMPEEDSMDPQVAEDKDSLLDR